MQIIFIPFGIFAICSAAQFYFYPRVERVLMDRHPEVWQDMYNRVSFATKALPKFIWRRGDRGLNDADLTRKTKQAAILSYVATASWVVFAVLLVSGIGLRRL